MKAGREEGRHGRVGRLVGRRRSNLKAFWVPPLVHPVQSHVRIMLPPVHLPEAEMPL